MKAVIIYDSVFGNTEKVAVAIGESLDSHGDVKTLRVGDLQSNQLAGIDLLIVGSPTRAFKPTKQISSFLAAIPANGLKGIRVSAFDTRISTADINSRFLTVMVNTFGYAAEPIANRLQKKGGDLVIRPEGFFVQDSEGPLKEGELERAGDWGTQLAAAL